MNTSHLTYCFLWHMYALFGTSAIGWLTQIELQFPILQPPSDPPPSSSDSPPSSSCSAEVYEGRMCILALQSQQSYIPGRGDDSTVYIESGKNTLEDSLTSQIQLLRPLASEECLAAIIPFLCFYTFGLCDGSGTLHRPSSKQCAHIRNVTCKTEWAQAVAFVGEDAMPQCHLLPDTTVFTDDSMPTGTYATVQV